MMKARAAFNGGRVFALKPGEEFPRDFDYEEDRVVSIEIWDDGAGPQFPGVKNVIRDRLTRAQFEAFHCDIDDSAAITGLGGGKTYAISDYAMYRATTEPQSQHLICMSSIPHAQDVVIPEVDEALDRWGFEEDVDYSWRGKNGNKPDLHINVNGHSVHIPFRSLGNPKRLRGVEPATLLIDEARDCPAEGMLIARNRVRCNKARTLRTRLGTTPNGYDAVFDHYDEGDAVKVNEFTVKNAHGEFVVSVFERKVTVEVKDDAGNKRSVTKTRRYVNTDSSANPFVREGYDADLVASMDSVRLKQEKRGLFIPPATIVCYMFDRKLNTRNNIEFNPELPIYVGQDFNIGKNASVLGQVHEFPGEFLEDGSERPSELHLFDEVKARDTWETRREIKRRYPDARVIFYPDPAGRQRSPNSKETNNQLLGKEDNFKVNAFKGIIPVHDSVFALNKMFAEGDTEYRRLFIHRKCKETIKDCGQVEWHENEKDIKKETSGPGADRTHFLDGLRYLIWGLFKPSKIDWRKVDAGMIG